MCSTETVTVDSSNGGGTVGDSSSPTTVGSKPLPDTNNNLRNPNRRSNKPIMEKRRRARINNCLNELKSILLEAMRKDPARHSKLEKADILELTVTHLKSLHRENTATIELAARYRAGYTECASEVSRFLGSPQADGMDPTATARLMAHLNDSLHRTTATGTGILSPDVTQTRTPLPRLSGDSSTPVISLVPSRLASGELAFVVPAYASIRNGIHITHRYHQLSPEIPLELKVPMAHGGSTSSPTSSTSSLSPAYAAQSYSPYYHQAHQAQPLALVTPKTQVVNLSCWRPW